MLYSLIHDDQLLLGPIKYNHMLINSDLEDLEIETRLNSSSYEQVPIQFDEKTFLLLATEVYEDCDGKYQKYGPLTWQIIKTDDGTPREVVFTYPVVDKTLDEVKNERKALVAPERRNKENTKITVTVQGTDVEVSTSRDNRLALTSKLMSSPELHNFKFDNEVWLEINSTDLETIIQAIDDKVQEAFDWEFAKLQEIDACETIDEVCEVEIIPSPVLPEPQVG